MRLGKAITEGGTLGIHANACYASLMSKSTETEQSV